MIPKLLVNETRFWKTLPSLGVMLKLKEEVMLKLKDWVNVPSLGVVLRSVYIAISVYFPF